MSQEKTEKATPKKREDARKKGQIARGVELPTALGFLGALFALNFMSDHIFEILANYFETLAVKVSTDRIFDLPDVHLLFVEAVKILAMLTLPIIALGLTGTIAGSVAQTGFKFTPEALKPSTDKFNPVSNIKRTFGMDSIVNLLKSVIKLSVLGVVAYGVLMPMIENAPALIRAPVGTVAVQLGNTLYDLALRYGVVMIFLAAADYGYAYYKHEKSLKMSKQEIRDEFKQQEGDPLVKSQRRRSAREIANKRSLGDVPSATVVVTNPTHFAVALRYDRERDAAPIVVAKGADHLAKKIREIARENGVPLVENPPLARGLYRMVEPSQVIPMEFFGAVAEVLAYVFRKNEDAASRSDQ